MSLSEVRFVLPVRMRLWLRGCGVAALTVAVCAPGLLAQIGGGIGMGMRPADASTSPVNVTGVVINAATGTPVPRALVQLGNRAMLTDHEGKFEFDQFAESR